MEHVNYFLSGGSFLGFVAAGLVFLRFWQKSHDRFFATFSISFFMMAIERVLVLQINPEMEIHSYIYIFRLVGFIFVIAAIVEKNREASPKVSSQPRDEVHHISGSAQFRR